MAQLLGLDVAFRLEALGRSAEADRQVGQSSHADDARKATGQVAPDRLQLAAQGTDHAAAGDGYSFELGHQILDLTKSMAS